MSPSWATGYIIQISHVSYKKGALRPSYSNSWAWHNCCHCWAFAVHLILADSYKPFDSSKAKLDWYGDRCGIGDIQIFWQWPENDGFCRIVCACWGPAGPLWKLQRYGCKLILLFSDMNIRHRWLCMWQSYCHTPADTLRPMTFQPCCESFQIACLSVFWIKFITQPITLYCLLAFQLCSSYERLSICLFDGIDHTTDHFYGRFLHCTLAARMRCLTCRAAPIRNQRLLSINNCVVANASLHFSYRWSWLHPISPFDLPTFGPMS